MFSRDELLFESLAGMSTLKANLSPHHKIVISNEMSREIKRCPMKYQLT